MQTTNAQEKDLESLSNRADEICSILKALSGETRLKIMCILGRGESSVRMLAEGTGQSASSVSQHLNRLRAAGLVESRREAQTIWYRCRPGIAQDLMATLCRFYR